MSVNSGSIPSKAGTERPTVAAIPGLERVANLCFGDLNSGNAIVQAENLTALDRLAPVLAGTVRCIYADPPYNNGESYTHYDDRLDHALWLRNTKERLAAMAGFLREDGSIWVSIDDREVHYLKVAMDSIFGRENFVTTIVWQHRTTRENRKVFSNNHEYLLVYAKNSREFRARRNRLDGTAQLFKRYKNPDEDPRGAWQSVSLNVQAGHATASQFYAIIAPNGRKHLPPPGRCWVYSELRMAEAIARNDVWFGKDGNGVPRLKRFLADSSTGLTPDTLWLAEEVGTTLAAKKHLLQLFPSDSVFDTPKPESLIYRILQIASDPGDRVMDAYLGSGTTAAVAHKTGRYYVGIEQGEQAVTHCAHRIRQVINGESGGISKTVGWSGGGGFDFFRTGPSSPATLIPRAGGTPDA